MVIFDQFITSLVSLIEVLLAAERLGRVRLLSRLSGQVKKDNGIDHKIFLDD